MDSISIDLKGSEISSIELAGGHLRIHFSRAYLIKTMTGSHERTRWWQAGDLVIDDAEPLSPIPAGPIVCLGGDIDENIYTYRDMLPVPLVSRGHARCELRLDGEPKAFVAEGTGIRLEMRDTPRYIEHLRST
ncbi:MAG: hypothetical protein LJE61_07735 [Thiocapsa sp.]|nr:hypothetical protein [Thiocapsa sp.]MCG6898276.1 hypothetical protein [Thiocapsa sp.]MCG6985070.1 hypothetical protein [Thiocapsa sp.]